MNGPTPKRRWWWKKRWWGAISLWLLFSYFVLYGLGAYSVGRGWLAPGDRLIFKVFAPIGFAAELLGLEEQVADFTGWCLWTGDAHRDPDTPSIFPSPSGGGARGGIKP